MSLAGIWQKDSFISPLITGPPAARTDKVQAGDVEAASSHPVCFIKCSLIPPHNIINFVSRWTQWTSNLINFCHWMSEERLNEINARYFPIEAANLESAPDCWQVRHGTPVWPITLCLDQSQTFSAKMENAICGLEINHLRAALKFRKDSKIMTEALRSVSLMCVMSLAV